MGGGGPDVPLSDVGERIACALIHFWQLVRLSAPPIDEWDWEEVPI